MSDALQPLRPVQREPIVRHVHRELRSAILRGRMLTGERLVETTLAEQLQVSRTPVREAIQKLESEGLVRRLPYGGVVVEDAHTRHFEVLLLRGAVEGAAIRLSCQRASDEEIRELVEAAEHEPGAVARLSRAERGAVDRSFHARLARAAHSPRVSRLVEEYYEYSWAELWLRMPDELDRPNADLLHGQHLAIAHALADRNPDAAEKAVRDHLDTVREVMRRHLGASIPVP